MDCSESVLIVRKNNKIKEELNLFLVLEVDTTNTDLIQLKREKMQMQMT